MSDSLATPINHKVLNNIFMLSEYEIPEDRFTAAWGYVLSRELSLAQAVADILLKDRGLTAKVIEVSDHPDCNSLKKPDFLIKCEGLDILVEHKLDALLHQNQLENYLNLSHTRTYVSLIAPAIQSVPQAVLDNDYYLKPEGKSHFRWSDFYTSVKSQPGWLTQEFADYMASLGMTPFTLKSAEDIFDRSVKPVQFDEVLKLAADQVFAKGNPSCSLMGTSTGLGRQVRTPHAFITLIYIWAEQRSTHVRDYDGPVLAVEVYERDSKIPCKLENATLTTPSGIAVRRHNLYKPRTQGEGTCHITYVAPLVEIIQDTREATVLCMAEMLQVIRGDYWPKD